MKVQPEIQHEINTHVQINEKSFQQNEDKLFNDINQCSKNNNENKNKNYVSQQLNNQKTLIPNKIFILENSIVNKDIE